MQLHLDQALQHRCRQPRVGAQWQRDVLGHAEVGEQAIALQQHTDVATHLQQRAAAGGNGIAEQRDRAGDRSQLAGQRCQHGGFAATGRTEHGRDAAAWHLQRHIAQDRAPAAIDADTGQLHDRGSGSRHRCL